MSPGELALLAVVGPAALTAMEFMVAGECRGADHHLFFPPPGRGSTGAALDLCGVCPVTRECAEYALSENLEHGVWGGLKESERRALRRRHLQPGACETCGRPTARHLAFCHRCEERHA